MDTERFRGRRPVLGMMGVVVALAMTAGSVGCEKGAGRAETPGAPTSPAGRTVVGVTIGGTGFSGPVLPEQTIQLTAALRYSDGTTEDFTGSLTWSSSNDAVATVDAGRVKAIGTGEVTITARLKTDTPQSEGSLKLSIQIIPALTISGLVRESSPNAGRPVSGARVEVTGLTDTMPRTTMTDGAGVYTIAGVRAPIRVRVSKDGYDTIEQSVDTATADVRLDVQLYGGRIVDTSFVDNFPQDEGHLAIQTKRYPFQFKRPGLFEAAVNRDGCSYNAYYGIGVELWRDGALVTRATEYDGCHKTVNAPVDANGRYELRVIGSWVWGCCNYRVTARHPE